MCALLNVWRAKYEGMSIYKLCGHVDCECYDYDSALCEMCECNREGHDPKKCIEQITNKADAFLNAMTQ